MDNYSWFKFSPLNWSMGKIQRCSLEDQARFIRLCCLYWSKSGFVSIEDARVDLEGSYDTLLKRSIIVEAGENIRIEFLDEQLNEIESKKESSSTKGFIGNLKRWHTDIYKQYKSGKISIDQAKEMATQSPKDRPPIATRSPNIAYKKREDNIREEEKSAFELHSLSQVQDYFDHYNEPDMALEFYNHYMSNGWMVGKVQMSSLIHSVEKWIKNKDKFKTQKNGKHSETEHRKQLREIEKNIDRSDY